MKAKLFIKVNGKWEEIKSTHGMPIPHIRDFKLTVKKWYSLSPLDAPPYGTKTEEN